MKDIYYVNSAGVKIDLMAPPYMLQTGDLFNYAWDYEKVESSSISENITNFTSGVKEMELTLSIMNYSRESYQNAIDHFFEVAEYDVAKRTPGKLYVGDQYMQCYIIASEKTDWEYDIELLDNKITLASEYAFWIKEKFFTFVPSAKEKTGDYLDCPFDCPFDLMGDEIGTGSVTIDHYDTCNFLVNIYGACTNPRIKIGKNLIGVTTKLDKNEYLTIDSRDRSVVRTRVNGVEVNEFDNRYKEGSIFDKVEPGYNLVSWDGSFGFDLTVYTERKDAAWK